MANKRQGDNMRQWVLMALAAIAVAVMALGGCSSVDSQFPIGIGTGPNSLKQSPCACISLPNAAGTPGYVFPATT